MLLNFAKLGGLQLCGVTFSWVEIFLSANFPGENYLGWKLYGWELSWVEFSRWELSCVGIFFSGSFLGGNCPLGIIRAAIFRVGVFLLLPLELLKGRCLFPTSKRNSMLNQDKIKFNV